MKTAFAILLLLLSAFASLAADSPRLDLAVRPVFGSQPVAYDTLAYSDGSGRTLSVTRCDLLLSGAALQKDDGVWIEAAQWSAYLSPRNGRDRCTLGQIPAGQYRTLRFHVGLPPSLNHQDPATFPAGHALNPMVNSMHWGWQGGYIFAALEGLWQQPNSPASGYSFHLANDENLVTVELPVALDLSRGRSLHLDLDLQPVFLKLALSGDRSSTHSRSGDEVAADLKTSLAQAFRVDSVTDLPTSAEAAVAAKAVMADDATPYGLTFSNRFPRPSLPADNPLTEEGVILGERLFHERDLSGNGSQSCASCHERRTAFGDPRRVSIGAFGDAGTRQAMPLFNLAWKSSFFWDGRAATLRQQSLEPVTNVKEMHASLPEAMAKIAQGENYEGMFEDAFGSPAVTPDRVARALEQYLLTIVSDDSKFDRAQRGEAKLTVQEQRGAALFNTESDPGHDRRGADCFHCHGGALFQSVGFANNGLDSQPSDQGRYTVTQLQGDLGKFAVPSLRNVALTAPYMHDGRFKTLEEVIEHYDHGVQRSDTLDPNLAKHPQEGLQLSAEDKAALVAFLKTLTDYELIRPGPPPEPRFVR